MTYYPDQRYLLEMTSIQREQFLPENAVGTVDVRRGSTVNLRDVVARGRLPSRIVMVNALEALRLKSADQLEEYLQVKVEGSVIIKDTLAMRGGRRALAPVSGTIVDIHNGYILIQTTAEIVELEAGLDGQVVTVTQGRGAVIETFGTLVQGVWGNNQRVISTLRIEPEDGLESLYGEDLDIQYRGSILVTRRPLRMTGLQALEDQNLGGIIAPSMDADLLDAARNAKGAILLTEGFGSFRMTLSIYNLLVNYDNRQATLDAVAPNRWQNRRPEIIINPSARPGPRLTQPNPDLTLQPKMTVRLTRVPNLGVLGTIVNLPKTPVLLENGLRAVCAQVELVTGEKVTVPLANLEVLGQ
jgi:hypothetical protein